MELAFVPLYIKYLGVEAYGLIGIHAILQAWLTLLDMGMTPTLSREMARFTGGARDAQSIRDLLRSVEIVAICVLIVIVSGVYGASGWLASDWLRAEKLPVATVAQALSIMGVVTALRFFETIYRSCLVGLQQQVLLNVVFSVMATLRGLGAVGILAWVSPTIEAFFLWQAAISIISVALLVFVVYGIMPDTRRSGQFSTKELQEIWRFAGGMMAITFLALLLTQVDKILLSKLISLKEYGYYALAAVVTSGLGLMVGPVTQAIYPRFNELLAKGDQAGLVATFHKGAQLVTVTMGSAAVILIAFAEIILQLWTQDAILAHKVAPFVSVLALGTLLNGLMWMPYQMQLAHGWTSLAVKVNTVAVAIIIPAILWVTPKYGALGAAWVWVLLNAGYATISIHFVFRRILVGEKWRWYFQDVLIPLCVAAANAFLFKLFRFTDIQAVGHVAFLFLTSVSTCVLASMAASNTRKQLFRLLARA